MIYVRAEYSGTVIFLVDIFSTTSWPYPQGSRSRKFILPSPCTYLIIILFKLNLEVPVHDFNEAEGKLVIG